MRKWLCLLVLLACSPLSREPLWGQAPRVGEESGQDKEDNATLGQGNPKKSQSAMQDRPFVVDIEGHHNKSTESAADKAEDNEKEYRTRGTFRATVAYTILTAILVLIGAGGVWAAHRTLKAIEGQVGLMKRQVELMEEQALLTRQSLTSTENFATLDQRPYLYLSPEGNAAPFKVGTAEIFNQGVGFIASIHMKNFGKSPARNVFHAGEILVGGNLDQQADEWFAKIGIPIHKTIDSKTGFYKLPSGIGMQEMSAIMQGAVGDVSAHQWKVANAPPKPPAICVNRIEYRDSVGNLYWTDICYKLGSGPRGEIVPMLNSFHNEVH